MLDSATLADRLQQGVDGNPQGLFVIPEPDISSVRTGGESSITLRLGRWFISLRQSSQAFYDVNADDAQFSAEAKAARKYFIPFGKEFTLHPGRFVLASTLEWVKFPPTLGGYVGGKSTWARRGLIIETAAGVHPGFNGCLTLELANVGEVPIKLRPGMKICQIFIHDVPRGVHVSDSVLKGRRSPYLGSLKNDEILTKLTQT